MAELSPGSEFAGHRIEATAGRGGMGIVYRALDIRLNRVVAMKVLTPDLAEDPEFRERFERESQLAASIDHANVIPIHHAGEENGVLFITMRYVEGTDLAALIAREGRVDPARAVAIVSGVAAALDAAHDHGLIHRDVKPANILIEQHEGRSDHVYLTDFGLTKLVGTSGPTRTGYAVGTFDYMAPEQFLAQPIDARADIYALGGVLFEALTGRVPFPRPGDAARMYAHIQEQPPAPTEVSPDLPPAIDAVASRALAKDPDERYQTADELAEDMAAAIGVALEAPATPLPSPPPRRPAQPTVLSPVPPPPATTPEPSAPPAPEAPAEPAEPESDPGRTVLAPTPTPTPPSAPPPQTAAPPARESRRSRRPLLFGLGALIVAAIVVVIIVAGGGGGADTTTPQGTVTAFLDRLAGGDGSGACELLTAEAQQQAINAPGNECSDAIIMLAGRDNAPEKADAIRNAHFTTQASGDQATAAIDFPDPQLALGSGTSSLTISLTKSGSDWRISDIRSFCLANNFPC